MEEEDEKKMEGKSHKWKTLCFGPEAAASGLYKNLLFFFFIFIYFFFVCVWLLFSCIERDALHYFWFHRILCRIARCPYFSPFCVCARAIFYIYTDGAAQRFEFEFDSFFLLSNSKIEFWLNSNGGRDGIGWLNVGKFRKNGFECWSNI